MFLSLLTFLTVYLRYLTWYTNCTVAQKNQTFSMFKQDYIKTLTKIKKYCNLSRNWSHNHIHKIQKLVSKEDEPTWTYPLIFSNQVWSSPAAGNSSVDQSVHELTGQPEKGPINNKLKGSYCHQLQQLLMHLIPFIDLSAVFVYWDSVVIKWSSWANSICLNRWLYWPSLESLQCSLQ